MTSRSARASPAFVHSHGVSSVPYSEEIVRFGHYFTEPNREPMSPAESRWYPEDCGKRHHESEA
jgi:hypothetical protein